MLPVGIDETEPPEKSELAYQPPNALFALVGVPKLTGNVAEVYDAAPVPDPPFRLYVIV